MDLPLLPSATALEDEWVDLGSACGGDLIAIEPALLGSCTQTDAAADSRSPRVLVMGDSHAQQLMSPLTVLADERGWGVVALLKGGCSIGKEAPAWSSTGPPCEQWRESAIDYATRIRPDAVYLVATRASPEAAEVLIEGIEDIIDTFTAQGIKVVAVRDSPRFTFDMYECALSASEAAPGRDLQSCDVADVGFADERTFDVLASREGVTTVDFRPWFCPEGICRGSIGNVAVYIDDNHVSSTYGRTLVPMLERMLGLDDSVDLQVG